MAYVNKKNHRTNNDQFLGKRKQRSRKRYRGRRTAWEKVGRRELRRHKKWVLLGGCARGGWGWPLGQMPVERYPRAVSQHTQLTPLTRYSAQTQSGVNGQLAFCAKHHRAPLISVIDSERELAPRTALSQRKRGGRGWRKTLKIVGTAKTPGNPLTLTRESSFGKDRTGEKKQGKAYKPDLLMFA